jgi:hypothetical protein
MASCSALASLIMMFVASSALIFAVRYFEVVSNLLIKICYGWKTYSVDLNAVIVILGLDSQKQRSEPLKRSKISAHPEEVHFPQPCASLWVVHAVPDTLEDGGERRDTDTGTDEHGNFEFKDVFGGGTEGAVDVDSGKDLAECDLVAVFALLALFARLGPFGVAAERFAEGFGEVADHADVHGDVVFFGGAGECEGVVLPDGHFRAAQEDVLLFMLATDFSSRARPTHLSSTGLGVLLLDLNFADVARMLNDLGNVRLVSSSDLTRDALGQVRESTVHPVLPEDTDTIAEGRKIRRNHAEGAMDGPEEEENDEEVVRVPEALEVCATCLLRRCERDRHERDQHNVAAPSGTSGKVGKDEAHEP